MADYTGHASVRATVGKHHPDEELLCLPGLPHAFEAEQLKGVKKKTSTVTFLVAEGVIIIAQQCYTPRWKRLGASFQVITESFLCDQYFKIYQ